MAAQLQPYLQAVARAIQTESGAVLAPLLSLYKTPYGGPQFPAAVEQVTKRDAVAATMLPPNWRAVTMAHLDAVVALSKGNVVEAFTAQLNCLERFLPILDEDTNWFLPVCTMLCEETPRLARYADEAAVAAGTATNAHDCLERTTQTMVTVWSKAFNHRVEFELSKNKATLFLTNQLFRAYFRLNNLRQCSFLIRSLSRLEMDRFPRGQVVAYRYYLGRMALFEDRYKEAETELAAALASCPRSATHNRRLILQSLIPVRMQGGKLPLLRLLQKHHLEQFADICEAIKTGNVRLFTSCMEKNREWFISRGVYLMLERLQLLVYRTLLKKAAMIYASEEPDEKQKAQPHLDVLLAAFNWQGQAMDLDELECIIANLIFKKMIRGYLSHKHRRLVLSRQNAFPRLQAQ